ncbi:hypothetical protein LTR53_019446, partial [Teratosphaeriaceae sp. CCFEE 6253]
MRVAVGTLAVLAGVAPALAIPGDRSWGSGRWTGPKGKWGSWGNGGAHGGRPGGYWGPSSSSSSSADPSSASGTEVSPVTGTASTGLVSPTGYSNATLSKPYWANSTSTAGGYPGGSPGGYPGSYDTTTYVT